MQPVSAAPYGEERSFDLVAQRLRGGAGRLPRVLLAAIEHLHEFVRETRPTATELRSALALLTEIGQVSDEKRHEWVLLADLLGVSSLVEEINSRRPAGATPNTVRGPFYRADAPALPLGADISLDRRGEPLHMRGRVLDLDGEAVAGASVETWQANHEGLYENQQPDRQPEFNLRGIFTTDQAGRFAYRTVRPAGYAVPQDGPAGRLLASVGCPLRRPAHLHFMIGAPGFETVTTHVFDRAEALTVEDPLFAVRPELIGDIRHETCRDGKVAWALDFDFVLVRARPGRQAS